MITKNNCYFNARMYAKLSRREASFKIATSESSLCEYENGTRPVPDEIALVMAEVYRTPWLRVQHLMKNKVFADVFGLINEDGDNQSKNVLMVQKEVGDVMKIMPDIVDEAINGENFNQRIIKECKEAVRSLLLLVHFGNKKTACAGTQTVDGKHVG